MHQVKIQITEDQKEKEKEAEGERGRGEMQRERGRGLDKMAFAQEKRDTDRQTLEVAEWTEQIG